MTNSDKAASPQNFALGQERPEVSVTPARADTGNQHGWKPVSITLPWPAKALQSNSRAHWAEKAKATKKARLDAWAMANSHNLPCWPEARILVEYYPPTRRGDPQNVPASLKAYIDGIADAMGVDDRCFKVDFPSVFAGTKKGGEVVFRVYER